MKTILERTMYAADAGLAVHLSPEEIQELAQDIVSESELSLREIADRTHQSHTNVRKALQHERPTTYVKAAIRIVNAIGPLVNLWIDVAEEPVYRARPG